MPGKRQQTSQTILSQDAAFATRAPTPKIAGEKRHGVTEKTTTSQDKWTRIFLYPRAVVLEYWTSPQELGYCVARDNQRIVAPHERGPGGKDDGRGPYTTTTRIRGPRSWRPP